jgi:hypothetical protein
MIPRLQFPAVLIASEDFGRLVEPFLTKGMFAKHAKR